MIEANDGKASGAECAVDLVNGLLRARCVMQDAKGVDHVEGGVGKGEHLGVRTNRSCGEPLDLESPTSQIEMPRGEVQRVHLRARAGKLGVIGAQAGSESPAPSCPRSR